jgi:hypothetical protein
VTLCDNPPTNERKVTKRTLTMNDEPKKPRLVVLAEKRLERRKTEEPETLFGLMESLEERAAALEAAGDHEFAIELRAAVFCISCAMHVMRAQLDLEDACEELDKLLEPNDDEAPEQ